MDLVRFLERQRAFSLMTFGPGDRTKGIIDHIKKEIVEIENSPKELVLGEWVDIIILALDQTWRLGYSPEDISEAIAAKQIKNIGRKWPDWRTSTPEKAIEHDRSED